MAVRKTIKRLKKITHKIPGIHLCPERREKIWEKITNDL